MRRRCPKPAHNPELIEQWRKKRGAYPEVGHPEECPILVLERCPQVVEAAHDHGDYKRGHLKTEGGLMAQPHKWLELQRMIEAEVLAYEKKQIEKGMKSGGRK